jgi:hypothetical protein
LDQYRSEEIIFMIFVNEMYLDFTSFDHSFKTRIKVLIHDYLDITDSQTQLAQK